MTQPDTSDILDNLRKQYRKTRAPIITNFRDLVPWIPYNSHRYTHQLHSYPAKVIPQIPNFFLAARSLTHEGSIIVDPFSGSGTVALESCLGGHNVVVSDSNPIARLITHAKITPQRPEKMEEMVAELQKIVAQSRVRTPPDVVNIEYWYTAQAIKQLTRIASSVQKLDHSPFRRISELALSICARKASFADPRVSVPVKLRRDRYPSSHPLFAKTEQLLNKHNQLNVMQLFYATLSLFVAQVSCLWPIRSKFGKVVAAYENSLGAAANALAAHAPNTGDLVITSPPYLGAQKYIRSASLTLGWLSLSGSTELRRLEDLSIGREHYPKSEYKELSSSGIKKVDELLKATFQTNPLRAHIAAKYLTEMEEVLNTCYRIIKPRGKLILVSGSNTLCGKPFDTTNYLKIICANLGFSISLEMTDIIKSRGLMTRRNKTAGIIPSEAVTIFEK